MPHETINWSVLLIAWGDVKLIWTSLSKGLVNRRATLTETEEWRIVGKDSGNIEIFGTYSLYCGSFNFLLKKI